MSDTDLGQTAEKAEQEPDFLHIQGTPAEQPEMTVHCTDTASTPVVPQTAERSSSNKGTIEHLAARQPISPLDTSTPAFKQRLVALRAEFTRLVTGVRWNNLPVEKAADQIIPLLNVGPVPQWKAVLIPFLYEIDRAGNLVPVWVNIIERGDSPNFPADANPAETMLGRARRFAILLLGHYKHGMVLEKQKSLGFARQTTSARSDTAEDLPQLLGRLATDPSTSLYATQALAQLGTNNARQALLEALKVAEGWAKIDVIEALLTLKLEQFREVLLNSALERVSGLESYASIPLYRAIPLVKYLYTGSEGSSHTARQAALVLGHVLLNSLSPATGKTKAALFEHNLPALLTALLDEVHVHATWEYALAIHYFGRAIGHYWEQINKGKIKNQEIIDPIYDCLPMMNEVERWINGPGRNVLLDALNEEGDDSNLVPLARVLGDLRDTRAIIPLAARLHEVHMLTGRTQALTLDAICTTLGRLGDRNVLTSMQQLLQRTIDTDRRMSHTRRSEPLASEDTDVPGSIIYAAFLRVCGVVGDRSSLDSALIGLRDFDPYVRSQALDALKRLDPKGDDARSRQAISDLLSDPRDAVVRSALQVVVQYRYYDALPQVRRVHETRPPLAAQAFDTLRQLNQI